MATQRLVALDVLRGLTIALMILVNTPGSWEYVYPPLRHSDWNGVKTTDLVFPFFLFIVGNIALLWIFRHLNHLHLRPQPIIILQLNINRGISLMDHRIGLDSWSCTGLGIRHLPVING